MPCPSAAKLERAEQDARGQCNTRGAPAQKSKGQKYRPQFPKKQPRGAPPRDVAAAAAGPSSSLKG